MTKYVNVGCELCEKYVNYGENKIFSVNEIYFAMFTFNSEHDYMTNVLWYINTI